MKILHIGQLIGGLDVYIRNSIIYSDNTCEFVIAHGKADNSKPIIKNGKVIKEYKINLYRSLNPWKDFKGLWQVLKIIRVEKPDIIHCHSAKGGFIGRVTGFLTRTKTFYTPHAFSYLSSQSKIKRKLYLCLEKTDRLNSCLLACSESERQLGIDVIGYLASKALVWHNAVPDITENRIVPFTNENNYIVYVGRPSYQKNTLFLIDVVRDVCKKHPGIKFYLLGVGYYSPDLKELKEKIETYKLQNNIKLLPWISQEETFGIVKNSLFYLTVSRYEGLPLSVIEAMALSKPIIASDVVGNKDCVQNKINGFLLPLDTNIFVEKINLLIETPDLRERYGINSRNVFMQEFDIQKQIQKLTKIYHQVSQH